MLRKPIYSLDEFPEFSSLPANYPIILEELQLNARWKDWPSDASDAYGHCKFLTGNWTVSPLYFGRKDTASVKIPGLYQLESEQLIASLPTLFPKTTALLKKFPSINFAGFSRLHAHSILEPHRHQNKKNLILHLGLIIPKAPACGLKVGRSVHHWTKPGDVVIFDDTYLHSAWNNSDEERTILYVDFVKE